MVSFDDVLKALGGHWVTDGEGTDYGSWTPNTVKSLIISHDGVYVEKHGANKGALTPANPKNADSRRSPLRALSYKQFGALEVIVAPESMFEGVDLSRFFTEGTRIGAIYRIPDESMMGIELLAGALRREREAYAEAQGGGVDARPLLLDAPVPLQFAVDLSQMGQYVQVKPYDMVMNSFQLSPQTYSADMIGGTLETFLSGLCTRPRMPEEGPVETVDAFRAPEEENDGLAARLAEFEVSPLRMSLLRLLKAAAQRGGVYLDAIAALTWDLSPLDSQPEWFPVVASSSVLGQLTKEQFHGVMCDCENEALSAALYLHALPKEQREKLGFDTISKSITIQEVIDALNGEREPDKSVPDEALSFFNGVIFSRVELIAEEYTRIFSSGYEVIKPFGILAPENTGADGKDSKGRVLAINDDDRAFMRLPDSVTMETWKVIKGLVPQLEAMPTRDINEIAEIVVNGKDSSGAVYAKDTEFYFPYKMLEYAFGRGFDPASPESYPRLAAASKWETYLEQEVKPSLETMLQAVVKKLLQRAASNGEDYTSKSVKNSVSGALERIYNAMTTCFLVSSFEVNSRATLTKLKLRSLTHHEELGDDIAKESVERAYGVAAGNKSRSYAPVRSSLMWEHRYDVDTILANAAPIFAYKILEAKMSQGANLRAETVAIFGLGLDETIVDTSKALSAFAKSGLHVVLAGSRSGKGLMTQAYLAAMLIAGKALGLADNKPDMASLLLEINPNAFVINGPDFGSEKGTDLFGHFGADQVEKLGRMAHVPSYLRPLGFQGESYPGLLGTVAYIRYMILAMGILLARTNGEDVAEQLGGKKGVSFVFDEISNVGLSMSRFFVQLAKYARPADYVNSYDTWEASGFDEKKKPKDSITEVHLWASMFSECIRMSADKITTIGNANYKNREQAVSDIFLIGQHEVAPTPVSTFVPPLNRTQGVTVKLGNMDNFVFSFASSLTAADAFIGYNKERPQYLNQGSPNGIMHDKLSETVRAFAYVQDFNGPNIERALVKGDEQLAKTALPFRPGLLYAEAEEDGYCWPFSVEYMKRAGVDVDSVRKDVSLDDGRLDPALGFIGYLERAGVSRAEAAATLQKLSDAANLVVKEAGYPGTWQEWLVDLRPKYMYSSAEFYAAFNRSENPVNAERELFARVYPNEFPEEDAADPLRMEEEDAWDDSAFASLTDTAPAGKVETVGGWGEEPKPTAAPVMPVVSAPAPIMPDIPDDAPVPVNARMNDVTAPAPGWDYSTSPVTPNQYGGFSFNKGTPRTIHAQELTPDGVQDAIYQDMRQWVGDWGRVKRLGVAGGLVILNGVAYQTKVAEEWDIEAIPEYLREAVRSSNIAPIANWRMIREMHNLRRMSFDSWQFYMSYVCPDLGFEGRKSIGQMFAAFPTLQHITIAGEEFDRSTWSEEHGVPTGMRRYDDTQAAMYAATRYLSRGRKRTWEWTTDTWKRNDIGFLGKTWRSAFGFTASALFGVGQLLGGGGKRAMGAVARGLNDAR